MENLKTQHFVDREAWRAWLAEHGQSEGEVWLVFYKINTGRPSIPYSDSVEEALCFGWIDSIIKSIDDQKYMRKFTPRKPGSKWSALNKRRAAKMIEEGRMTRTGLERIDFDPGQISKQAPSQRKELVIPPWILEALKENQPAWENFNRLAPSHKRAYFGWVLEAKKEETRRRRLQEVVHVLAQGKKLGLK